MPNRQDIPEETVWNYEAGLKLATGRVSGSLGVYYQVYDNFQVSVEELDANGNPTGGFVTESAGAASNLGVEAEIAVVVDDSKLFENGRFFIGLGHGFLLYPTYLMTVEFKKAGSEDIGWDTDKSA